jgi:WD40 repeat protein
VAFFPNGKQLASGSNDKTVRIWTLCAWSDKTHHLFGAPLKAAVFTLMCVRARLEQEQEQEQGRAANTHCNSLGCPWRCGCWSLGTCTSTTFQMRNAGKDFKYYCCSRKRQTKRKGKGKVIVV